jgi:hypothetical protein
MKRKQIRHWLFIDMEYCPFLSPFSTWSLLLGGTKRSFMSFAKWINSKRLIALRNISEGTRFDLPVTNNLWVSLSANVFIMNKL